MKKIIYFTVIMGFAMLISSCGKMPISSDNSYREMEIPYNSKEFKTDKNYFREVGNGKSTQLDVAKKIAVFNAKTMMADNVNSLIKSVKEQYINQVNIKGDPELAVKFEENTRNVTNQTLLGTVVIAEKAYVNKKGEILYYVVLEMKKENILDVVNSNVFNGKRKGLDAEKKRFAKIFYEEMNNF